MSETVKEAALLPVRSNVGFDTGTVDDLAALVKRLAHSLRQAAPDNDLPEKALDYLRRKGLIGTPFRNLPECLQCEHRNAKYNMRCLDLCPAVKEVSN